MTVRPLRAADEPAVRSLQTHLEFADPDLVTAAVDGPFLGLVAVYGGPPGGTAVPGGAVVGYAIAFPARETTLSELVVAPDHRRAGHGRALVAAVSERTPAERLVVTTPATAGDAKKFYEALGFDVEDRLDGFYGNGADALRLVRRE